MDLISSLPKQNHEISLEEFENLRTKAVEDSLHLRSKLPRPENFIVLRLEPQSALQASTVGADFSLTAPCSQACVFYVLCIIFCVPASFSAKGALISSKSIFRRFLEIKALFTPEERRVAAGRAVNTPVRFNFLEFPLGWRRCVIWTTPLHTAAKPAHTEEIECQHPLPKKPYRRTPRRQHALRESNSPKSPNATALTPWSIT